MYGKTGHKMFGTDNAMFGNGHKISGKKNGRYGLRGKYCPVYGDKNGNKGKGYYYWWVKKYGKEEADRRQKEYNVKRKNIVVSDEAKRNMRLAAIKKIEKTIENGGQLFPGYNPKGCQLFEEIMKASGTYIQHAENGGEFHIKELGYWVDGYDKENNIVYEYDEPWHSRQLEKDAHRQKEIEEFLSCKFIRIKDEE